LSWKLPGKLLCITLFFTSCHWYNIVVYFTKKMPFRVPKILRRIQWQNKLRMASECISYNLRLSPTYTCGARFVPLAHSTLPLLYQLRLLLQFFLRTLATMLCCQDYWHECTGRTHLSLVIFLLTTVWYLKLVWEQYDTQFCYTVNISNIKLYHGDYFKILQFKNKMLNWN
jgi:hypothetical protein